MATLWELYKGHSRHLKIDGEVTLGVNGVATIGPVQLQVSQAFEENCTFLAYFVPEDVATEGTLQHLIAGHRQAMEAVAGGVETSAGHPAAYGPQVFSSQLPFSGRVFMFVDALLDSSVAQGLVAFADAQGVRLEIRDRKYEDYLNEHEVPRAFISHDSRDKPYVSELANRLRSNLCPVWYDEYSLNPGDSLVESISAGITKSKKCVVVLSPNFLSNPGWGKTEFNAAMNKHISAGGGVIIPIWHDVTKAQVAEYSSLIVDLVAIETHSGPDEVFNRLYRVLTAEPSSNG